MTLIFTSIQAPNADESCERIAAYVARRLGTNSVFVNNIPWQERERQIDTGEADIGWICGLPYTWKADKPNPNVEILAVPVMKGRRYRGKPIYYSDVVVHRQSKFRTFADLRGAHWAINEPNSHSGYNLVRYYLASIGEKSGYFGRVTESGAHERSLELIISGLVDASAIDSTVLETEMIRNPDLKGQIRILETLGPSPIPPWVISRSLDAGWRQAIRTVFLEMHLDPSGHQILQESAIERFEAATDSDYDPIREMSRLARQVSLT